MLIERAEDTRCPSSDTVPRNEEWRTVPGHEGVYEVSSLGRVRSLDRVVTRGRARCKIRGQLLKQFTNVEGGHLKVDIKGRQIPVHQLVLFAFIGPRPDGCQACHWDDDRTNNTPGNLRWDTQSANMADRRRNRGTDKACRHGHPRGPENTFLHSTGALGCRACHREIYQPAYRERAKTRC